MTNLTALKTARDVAREACNKASESYAIASDAYATALETHLTWHVTTKHVAPEYCTDETWTVYDGGEYGFSVSNRYGCSKSADTPKTAIYNMMREWGMTDIAIEPVE